MNKITWFKRVIVNSLSFLSPVVEGVIGQNLKVSHNFRGSIIVYCF